MKLRSLLLLVIASIALVLLPSSGVAAAAECPNKEAREQQKSASLLPECRGWEQVSPVLKNGEEVTTPGGLGAGLEIEYEAAAERPLAALSFLGGEPGTESAVEFATGLAVGGAPGTGFSTDVCTGGLKEESEAEAVNCLMPTGPTSRFATLESAGPRHEGMFTYYSPNLACGVQQTHLAQPEALGGESPLLAPGESANENLEQIYVLNTSDNTRTLVTSTKPEEPQREEQAVPAWLITGAATNCEAVVFEEGNQSATGSLALPVKPGSSEYSPARSSYEWVAGSAGPVLVTVLPDGKPAPFGTVTKVEAGKGSGERGMVSADGNTVVFSAHSDEGKAEELGKTQVFERLHQHETVQVSASETTVPDRGAQFEVGSASGGKIFFEANYGLTSQPESGSALATACVTSTSIGCDLYEYSGGKLNDISADVEATTGDTAGANVRGVIGISENGEYVYFTAGGQLVPGSGQTEAENEAKKQANVFVYHAGTLSYVTTISNNEAGIGSSTHAFVDAISPATGVAQFEAARVSPSGQYLLLATDLKVTPYDVADAVSGKPDDYLYEYHYGASAVTCVSCNPSGARQHDPSTQEDNPEFMFGALGPYHQILASYVPRNLLNDGRVFFQQWGSLIGELEGGVPVSETQHAYEWQPAGFDGCVPEASGTAFEQGCVSLLDNGLSTFPTYLEDVSADGENVLLSSNEQLVQGDNDALRDLYDARVDGGRVYPPAAKECEEDGSDCQSEKGGELDKGARASEAAGEGNPALGPPMGRKEVESETTGSVGIKSHSHKGSTITLVVAAPGKGKITVSGSGVSTLGRSVTTEGNYTLKLVLGKKAKTAIKHHKKLKVKLKVSFVPMLGKSSSMTITVTV